jgi:hypothetical protein
VPVEPVLSPPRKYDSVPPNYLTDGYRFALMVLFLVMFRNYRSTILLFVEFFFSRRLRNVHICNLSVAHSESLF